MTLLEKTLAPDSYKSWSDSTLLKRFRETRATTERLCSTMHPEDYVIQTMPDVSPTKWHLAHTAWFFEAFILFQHLDGYRSPDKLYSYLFNSYYNAIGEQFCRPRRGQISRPTVSQVYDYRHHVDDHVIQLIENLESIPDAQRIRDLVVLGINHEQQHQELLVADIKHVLFMNPLYPALHEDGGESPTEGVAELGWVGFEGGTDEFGFTGDGFHFDSEGPRHKRLMEPFELATRLVTNGEFLEFVEDGGYQRTDLWLSLGWSLVRELANRELEHERFDKPLYWIKKDGLWHHFTLHGLKALPPDEPVAHVSYYEADAYARWASARLPTEFEWETGARDIGTEGGNFQDDWRFQPRPSGAQSSAGELLQVFGDVWEWTASAYQPYPRFQPAEGAVGEYNGKFMANQIVLRGGSCATPSNHIRHTYRNFFYASDRWQFMGFRLARDGA